MIISYSRRFIFLKTQKTAGSSVEIALSTLCGPQDVLTNLSSDEEALRLARGRGCQNIEIPAQYRPWWSKAALEFTGLRQVRYARNYRSHMPAGEIRKRMDPTLFDAFRKFTIVRNPWDREVSLYYWDARSRKNPAEFADFVRRRSTDFERKTFNLFAIDGEVVATGVLRYETLSADYERFVRSLGVTDVPPLANAKAGHRPSTRRDYRDLYDERTRDIVARRYAREIETFGYAFE